MKRLLILLPLSGCSYFTPPADPNIPLALGTRGGSASLTLITCAPNTERARMVEDIVLQLSQQGTLARAEGAGSSSRITLNLCAGGTVPAPQPARR